MVNFRTVNCESRINDETKEIKECTTRIIKLKQKCRTYMNCNFLPILHDRQCTVDKAGGSCTGQKKVILCKK